MKYKHMKQNAQGGEVTAKVESDEWGNLTVIVTKGTHQAVQFNVAAHAVKRTIKKLSRRV